MLAARALSAGVVLTRVLNDRAGLRADAANEAALALSKLGRWCEQGERGALRGNVKKQTTVSRSSLPDEKQSWSASKARATACDGQQPHTSDVDRRVHRMAQPPSHWVQPLTATTATPRASPRAAKEDTACLSPWR